MLPDPAICPTAVGADLDAASNRNVAATGAEEQSPAYPKGSHRQKGKRQTKRRWRLLQYLLGWLEAAALEGDGAGGARGAPVGAEEALAAATVAMVAVTCPGQPMVDGGAPVGVRTKGSSNGSDRGSIATAGGMVSLHRRCLRRKHQGPFLIETSEPPCPSAVFDIPVSSAAAAASTIGGGDSADSSVRVDTSGNDHPGIEAVGGAIADGVWGGALDNLGPFSRSTNESGTPVGKGWAAGSAHEIWGSDLAIRASGSAADVPLYVQYIASTLRECGKLKAAMLY